MKRATGRFRCGGTDAGKATSHTVCRVDSGATCAFLVRAVSNIDGFRYYYGGGLTYEPIKIGDW